MKKSTERRRIAGMKKDARRLFMNGLISSGSLDSMTKALTSAEKKL
ncbi:MAG: hypothetical protein VW551_07790 [Euryarchaeota archaeon]